MKKGFTLIELLAVIVILAIIALIATPIVLNIIKESRESAQLRSAEMYLDAVEQAVMKEKMTNTNFSPNECEVQSNGKLKCSGNNNEIKVDVDGENPKSGSITFTNGKIEEVTLTYGTGKTVVKSETGNLVYQTSICTVIKDNDNDAKITIGDEIECLKEQFYVINNDNKVISMLSKLNLDFTTNLQGQNWGRISFSETNYWYDYDARKYKPEYTASGSPYYVYDKNSMLYEYVENYVAYFKNKGLSSVSGTIISYQEYSKLNYEMSWKDDTCYWFGSAYDSSRTYYVGDRGILNYTDTCIECCNGIGVRPVIKISTDEI